MVGVSIRTESRAICIVRSFDANPNQGMFLDGESNVLINNSVRRTKVSRANLRSLAKAAAFTAPGYSKPRSQPSGSEVSEYVCFPRQNNDAPRTSSGRGTGSRNHPQ